MRIDGADTYDMLGDPLAPLERALAQAVYGAHRYHFTPIELVTVRRVVRAFRAFDQAAAQISA